MFEDKNYSKIYFILAIYHVLYLIVFFLLKCPVLSVVNGVSIIIYILLSIIAGDGKSGLSVCFLICFAEIMIFSSITSILLGWDSGFMLIIVSIIPLLFYSAHKFYEGDSKITFKYGMMMLVVFFIIMFVCFWGKLQIYHLSIIWERIFYVINISIAIITIAGFMMVFVQKVNSEHTELEEVNENLENKANYDTLTGLLNRRSFEYYIDKYMKESLGWDKPFSVLMCDIDDFKKVNDTYGHDCGDLVLKKVAKVLSETLRDTDTIFRWGGEEIIILVSGNLHIAEIIAERCRSNVEESELRYMGTCVKVTLTIGASTFYQGATLEGMIQKADQNLYIGKTSGKNKVVV